LALKKKIDKNNWKRKDHFDLYHSFEEPLYGLVSTVDCTKAYQKAKNENISFYLYYLYQSLKAVNEIDEFRLRILGDDIYLYDQIDVSTTVDREDNTFGFSYIKYYKDFTGFLLHAQKEIERVRKTSGLELKDHKNIIHFTAIPWISFTGLSHPRKFSHPDSIPKIAIGKYYKSDGKLIMPISVHVHHGLVDGLHIGNFFELFQELLNQ
jgi:chloramphenicol O-acetyltransferase type A